jgi:hypothetical protein
MLPILLLVSAVLAWALVRHSRTSRPAKTIPPKITFDTTLVHRYEPYADFDESIAKWVKENPAIDKWFWSKVAGVTHQNSDGTSRQEILKRCEARELLRLVPEPDNPVDRDAIAVLRQNGEQLGYLERRLARRDSRQNAKGRAVGSHAHSSDGARPSTCMVRGKHRDVSAESSD